MISLYNTLKESLLSGFDEIEASTDPTKDIEQFIKDNYEIKGTLQISKKPNKNGKYVVDCNRGVEVSNGNITSLTNNLFEWGETGAGFSCALCHSLISLEGAPKYVGGNFSCSHCESLTSLEGAPEKIGWTFSCTECEHLKSLKYAPKEVGRHFCCYDCDSLTSLEYAPKNVGGDFCCFNCGIKFKKPDIKKLSNIGGKIKN